MKVKFQDNLFISPKKIQLVLSSDAPPVEIKFVRKIGST